MPKGVYPSNSLPRDKKIYPAAMVRQVADLYAAGQTQKEIAASLSVSQKVIYRLMINHALPRRAQVIRDQRGANNKSWKGSQAGYQAMHLRVESAKGKPSHCEVCKGEDPTKTYDWANLTGRYEDIADYKRMCRSCHRQYDNARR